MTTKSRGHLATGRAPEPFRSWSTDRRRALQIACNAVLDTPEGDEDAWNRGVATFLTQEADRDLQWALGHLAFIADAIGDAGALDDVGAAIAVLKRLETDPLTGDAFSALVRVCREGYFAGAAEAPPGGWQRVGYAPPSPLADATQDTLPAIARSGIDPSRLQSHYDVIVVGSGPGGSVAAQVLSESGARVLLVERAAATADADLRGDHLHGKRMAIYRPTAGAGAGNPRVVVEPDGSSWAVDGDAAGDAWGLNAMTLGGGTRLWQGMAWRFLPEDFRMTTTYPGIHGASVADWPIGLEELDASYAWAEDFLGVSGERGALTARMPAHPGYPMPPLPSDEARRILGAAAATLGWETGPIPFAINSVERAGRPPCVACVQCMGHTCPVGAKNGAQNTFVPAALSTGRTDLIHSAQALAIVHEDGLAQAVRIGLHGSGDVVDVACDLVVVSAGAIESPRLLLASGLGNDHVGRHLHGHTVSLVIGELPARLPTFRGPGHSVATFEFVHDGRGQPGGGVLFDAFAPYPLQLMGWGDALGAPRWGSGRSAWLERALDHVAGVMSMGQEIPTPRSRVTIDSGRRDRFGVPAPRLHRATHPATISNLDYLRERSREWLTAAGAVRTVDVFARGDSAPRPSRSPATEHSAGTVRMGMDPAHSASDRWGRVHGTRNVYVCDASLHPSNGSVNPTLTLIANAHRVTTHLARG